MLLVRYIIDVAVFIVITSIRLALITVVGAVILLVIFSFSYLFAYLVLFAGYGKVDGWIAFLLAIPIDVVAIRLIFRSNTIL